jgi:large subunit ribosomal protein L21
MYAIVETGGKQYKVTRGDLIKVEKINGEVGEKVEIDRVILIKGEEGIKLGTPTVSGAKVVGKIRSHGKGEKIVIFKYKRRKNYRRKQGHRQDHTWLEIENIII